MTGIDRQNEQDAFLASKKATWVGFTKLTIWASAAVTLILVILALIFVVGPAA